MERLRGFPGLGTRTMRARFQMAGRLQELKERLKREVRKKRPLGPRLDRPSGPKAGEFFEDLIASAVSEGEKEEKLGSRGRLCISR